MVRNEFRISLASSLWPYRVSLIRKCQHRVDNHSQVRGLAITLESDSFLESEAIVETHLMCYQEFCVTRLHVDKFPLHLAEASNVRCQLSILVFRLVTPGKSVAQWLQFSLVVHWPQVQIPVGGNLLGFFIWVKKCLKLISNICSSNSNNRSPPWSI